MATLPEINGDLSREEVEHHMADLANYDDPPNLARARRYRTACRVYLGFPLEEIDHSGERARMKLEEVRKNKEEVEAFIAGQEVTTSTCPTQYQAGNDWRNC